MHFSFPLPFTDHKHYYHYQLYPQLKIRITRKDDKTALEEENENNSNNKKRKIFSDL